MKHMNSKDLKLFMKEFTRIMEPKLEIKFKGLHQLDSIKNVDKKLLIEAINFFLDKLISSRLKKTLTLNFNFERESKSRVWANCAPIDTETRPKEFEINIYLNNRLGKPALLRTIAHELVHVKQFATGEMRDLIKTPYITYYREKKYDNQKLDYWFQPWEIEANGLECGLYKHFKKHKMMQKKKETI